MGFSRTEGVTVCEVMMVAPGTYTHSKRWENSSDLAAGVFSFQR